jgi:hypothetical protein
LPHQGGVKPAKSQSISLIDVVPEDLLLHPEAGLEAAWLVRCVTLAGDGLDDLGDLFTRLRVHGGTG